MCMERPKPRLDYWGSKYSEPQSATEHATSTSRQNCVQIQYLNPSRLNVCVCVCVCRLCVYIHVYVCVVCVYGVCACVRMWCVCMCCVCMWVHVCPSVYECMWVSKCVCMCVCKEWVEAGLHFQSRRTPRYTHGFSWSAGFPQPLNQTFSNIII